MIEDKLHPEQRIRLDALALARSINTRPHQELERAKVYAAYIEDGEIIYPQYVQDEVNDLRNRIYWLIGHFNSWGEDGVFCFPDGDVWHRSDILDIEHLITPKEPDV